MPASKYWKKIQETFYVMEAEHVELDSGKIDDKATFYIAVSAAMPGAELVDVVPLRFKIGASNDVEKFVLSAMPGVRLSHTPQVPAAMPVRPDTVYLTIEAKGQMYERMLPTLSTLEAIRSTL